MTDNFVEADIIVDDETAKVRQFVEESGKTPCVLCQPGGQVLEVSLSTECATRKRLVVN